MSKRSTRRSVSVLPPTERQILHTAKSDAQADPLPAESSPQSPGLDVSDSVDRQIADLLDRIAEGLQHDEQMQFDRLTLARNYGQLVLELKWAVPHGKYMDMLKERFPRSSYDKCNRWRFISERDDEVEAAIQTHPDVLWGPTKMIAYLKGQWSPESETDGDGADRIGEVDGGTVESEAQRLVNEEADEQAQVDDAEEGEDADPDDGKNQRSVAKSRGGTHVSQKKYDKLMGRFQKGGDMHEGGQPKTKTAQPPGYRLTVVTPEKSDLEKFGTLLPSPTIDFKAHSVSGWVRAQDIGSTLASVGSALTASSLKKVRVVVEL